MERREEFNKEKAKEDRTDQFETFLSSVSSFGAEKTIKDTMQVLENLFKSIENMQINNKKPSEFEIYKPAKQELKKYYTEHKIINERKTLKSYLPLEEIPKEFSKNSSPEEVIKAISLKLKTKNPDLDFNEDFLFKEDTLNTISKSLETVIKIYGQISIEKDDDVKRFNLLYLYLILFEINIALIKPVYTKITGTKDKPSYEAISNFVKTMSEKLSNSMDFDLRHDAAHVLFQRRLSMKTLAVDQLVLNLYCCSIAHLMVRFEEMLRMGESSLQTINLMKGKSH